jgi:hypothetical protein
VLAAHATLSQAADDDLQVKYTPVHAAQTLQRYAALVLAVVGQWDAGFGRGDHAPNARPKPSRESISANASATERPRVLDRGQNLERITADRLHNSQKLNDVEPSPPTFHLRYEILTNTQPVRQIVLTDPRSLSQIAKRVNETSILVGVQRRHSPARRPDGWGRRAHGVMLNSHPSRERALE